MVLDEEYRPEVYKYTVITSEIMKISYAIQASKHFYDTTVINFDPNTAGYIFDSPSNPSIEVIKGTTNLSKSNTTNKFYKVTAEMQTNSVADTPQLADLSIEWEDTAGAKRIFKLDTQEELTRNDDLVDTEFIDTFASPEGIVELGFGDFYHMIDTEGSFREGVATRTVQIERTGSLKLNLPNN